MLILSSTLIALFSHVSCLTLKDHITSADLKVFTSVFNEACRENDLSALFYGTSGLKLLSEKFDAGMV
uniref:Dolichyl-diphosphooligosaccharide--protein glycosyltransferase subunit 2 n=1 Tax=Romanomermis culicivorax TaxID=13658 RepID=A0A915JJE0_ROMCU